MEPVTMTVLAASTLAGLGLASWAGLKGWNGWLELKRLEISHNLADHSLPPAGGRIELADLKERVRKLEASAAGIDL